MYTPQNLAEDIAVLTKINIQIDKSLDILKKSIDEKKMNLKFCQNLNILGFSFDDYKNIVKKININDIYKNELTEYTKELIKRYKENDAKHYDAKETYEGLVPTIKRYVEVFKIVDGILETFNLFVELTEINANYYFEVISNEIIVKNVQLPPLDKDYTYVDDMLPFLTKIKDVKFQEYLKKVDEEIDRINLETEENSSNNFYTESGFETFDLGIPPKPENDYEDLEDILKKMKKESGGF